MVVSCSTTIWTTRRTLYRIVEGGTWRWNGVIRPFQHKEKGEHAIGLTTGPNFHSLHASIRLSSPPIARRCETLDLSFAHILAYILAHPEKKKLYYSAATGSTKLGVGIFAYCTGPDVIDYASAILLKIPEMVDDLRSTIAGIGTSVSGLLKIVKEKAQQIFVGGQAFMLNDIVPPLVFKYLNPALLDLKPGETLTVPSVAFEAPPPSLETRHVYKAASMIYNKYLNDTKTLPSEWDQITCNDDYKRCVAIFWKRQQNGKNYELDLVNLVNLAYTEYKKPAPIPMPIKIMVLKMMSHKGIDKFFHTYFNGVNRTLWRLTSSTLPR